MVDVNKQVIELLRNTERVADQVLQNKAEIVELDKRRQSTREAIRDLGKTDDRKTWVTIGPILVKMEKSKALDLLKKGTYWIYNSSKRYSPFCFREKILKMIINKNMK